MNTFEREVELVGKVVRGEVLPEDARRQSSIVVDRPRLRRRAGRAKALAREDRRIIREALDALGLALAEHGHTWTVEQRRLYEQAIRLLKD